MAKKTATIAEPKAAAAPRARKAQAKITIETEASETPSAKRDTGFEEIASTMYKPWASALSGYAAVAGNTAPVLKNAVDDYYNIVKWGYAAGLLVQKAFWEKMPSEFGVNPKKLDEYLNTVGEWVEKSCETQADWAKQAIDASLEVTRKFADNTGSLKMAKDGKK